jgi:hypothetical protein
MSELKLLFLVGFMGLAFYGIFKWVDSKDTRPTYKGPPKQPTISFVPPGTPGAKTWEQLQRERWGR